MTFADVRHLPLDLLVVSSQQARTRDVEKDLDELAASIRIHGQLEPIVVAPLPGKDDGYEIIAGQRRFLAMRRLGAETIHAAILAERVDAISAHVMSVSENMVRRDLGTKDLIDACTRLSRKYGSIRAVAEELGLPYNAVRNYVKFDRLRPELKHLVELGKIDVKAALRIEDHYGEDQVPAATISAVAEQVAGMTNAQQMDFFSAKKRGGTAAARVPEGAPPVNGYSAPGAVKQIIVTLRHEDIDQLRSWAKDNNLTQDRAAAKIIRAFVRDAVRRS